MILKTFQDEDFNNYRLPSMILGFPHCTFKCGECHCQNSILAKSPDKVFSTDYLIQRYLDNNITQAIVFGGLEPLDSFDDVLHFIRRLRLKYRNNDPVIIYTGYDREEVEDKVRLLSYYSRVIMKFGRFIPNQKEHYDPVLGVMLASDNQYGVYL